MEAHVFEARRCFLFQRVALGLSMFARMSWTDIDRLVLRHLLAGGNVSFRLWLKPALPPNTVVLGGTRTAVLGCANTGCLELFFCASTVGMCQHAALCFEGMLWGSRKTNGNKDTTYFDLNRPQTQLSHRVQQIVALISCQSALLKAFDLQSASRLCLPRSPSSALFPLVWGGSPTKIDFRKELP